MANRQFTNWNKRIWVAVSFGPRNDIYFGQRRDKQTARETIICRLAAGNFEDETVSVQHIIYRMTADKFEYKTTSTQMRFVE